ncbi:triggering receptor expressed on myeloid cells 3-like isoform X1 [Saccopteryx bilineata]|uniref:triggering receptor expressed on myeloid cells 3-like isoform X1 n=1 Tax=Saccopteryx bilineata TaxID=59482 RepID=UPI00338F82E1
MGRTRLRGWPRLLLLLWVSGLRAAEEEESQCLLEGRNLTVQCLYNMLFASNLKAWQRVPSQGPPQTLIRTNTTSLSPKKVQNGRYLLEDDPSNSAFNVTVTGLRRQDAGLYQCAIDLSPRTPRVLPPRIRLALCGGTTQQPMPMPTDRNLHNGTLNGGGLFAFDLSSLPLLTIVLACGFILNKGLVFSVMSVLLWKGCASGKPNPGKQPAETSRS